MIVIVKSGNITTLYKFRHKSIRYFLCIFINKIKGHEVDIFKKDEVREIL